MSDWISRIRKGDILCFPGRVLRVVRDVNHKHFPDGHVRSSVTLSIRRCSWTHRPYTVYFTNDLRSLGVRPTRAKVSLRKKIDKAIEHELHGRIVKDRDGTEHCYPLLGDACQIDCCDVRGIA